MGNLSLIVGLGNPGNEYAETRHNIGFMLVERLAAAGRAGWKLEKKFHSRIATWDTNDGRMLLCEPQTFMNASGEAVGALVRFYQVPHEKILVAVDDADLPLGQIRLRAEGSSGGHHGLDSVENQLGTRQYPRLRLGIGRREGDGRQIANYVLGRFTAEERAVVEDVLNRAQQQVNCWRTDGVQKAMNQFNGAAAPKGNL